MSGHGFYAHELNRLIADLQAQGKTMPGSKHQLDPQYLDSWFWTVYEKADLERMGQVRADMVEAGARYRASLPKRYVQEVLNRHRVAVDEREARAIRVGKLRLGIEMRLRGIEPLTDRERLRLRMHRVIDTDLNDL